MVRRRDPEAMYVVDISLDGFDSNTYGLARMMCTVNFMIVDGTANVGMDSVREAQQLGWGSWCRSPRTGHSVQSQTGCTDGLPRTGSRLARGSADGRTKTRATSRPPQRVNST